VIARKGQGYVDKYIKPKKRKTKKFATILFYGNVLNALSYFLFRINRKISFYI